MARAIAIVVVGIAVAVLLLLLITPTAGLAAVLPTAVVALAGLAVLGATAWRRRGLVDDEHHAVPRTTPAHEVADEAPPHTTNDPDEDR